MGAIKKGISKLIRESLDIGSSIKGALNGPSDPNMPDAPPPLPTIDDAANAQRSRDALRRRRGMAATILTGPSGVPTPPTNRQTLLGA